MVKHNPFDLYTRLECQVAADTLNAEAADRRRCFLATHNQSQRETIAAADKKRAINARLSKL